MPLNLLNKPKVVTVSRLPHCQLCLYDRTAAEYDAMTKLGPWAFVCRHHYLSCCYHFGATRLQVK